MREEIPDHLDTLVLDLLVKQPDDRPQDAASVAERLRQSADEPHQVRGSRPPAVDTPDTPEEDRTPDPRVQPDTPPPAQTALAPTMTSSPVLGPLRRRTVLLGGLGAAALMSVPVALLLRDDGDPETRPYATLTGHTKTVNSVAFSSDGRTLATGGEDDTARLWKIK